ncbi:MAG TPA: 2TM domain-containing protein [Segetibacter sp.]
MDIQQQKENGLWVIAKRRAAFKISAFTYVMVNSLLVAIWYFASGPYSYFWPIWSMLGWGVGVATQYFHAYHGSDIFSAQKEYEKLKQQQQ